MARAGRGRSAAPVPPELRQEAADAIDEFKGARNLLVAVLAAVAGLPVA